MEDDKMGKKKTDYIEMTKKTSNLENFNASNLNHAPSLQKINIQFEEIEEEMKKKKLVIIVSFVLIFLLSQILFLTIYGVMMGKELEMQHNIPGEIQKAYKFSVLPNLQMASLFYPAPQAILDKYNQQIN